LLQLVDLATGTARSYTRTKRQLPFQM